MHTLGKEVRSKIPVDVFWEKEECKRENWREETDVGMILQGPTTVIADKQLTRQGSERRKI